MSTQDNKVIARRVYEIFSSDNLDALNEVFARDFVDHNPQPEQARGLKGLKEMLSSLRESFPDLQWTPEDAIAEGDKVASRITISGTQRGMYKSIPATGEHTSIPLVNVLRIVDGKVVERWGVSDHLSLLQQLGSAAPASLAKFGKAALAVALPPALVWAWLNDKLPQPWSGSGRE